MVDSIPVQNQICSKCAEANPADAVMCWACYWPLGGPATPDWDTTRETSLMWEDELGNAHLVPPKTWRDQTPEWLLPLSMAALFSSGWWRGKMRWAILGGALTGFGFSHWLFRRQRLEEKRRNAGPTPRQDDMSRLLDSLLRQSLSAGATQIRLTRRANNSTSVEFHLENQWRLQFEFSWRYWSGLQMEIFKRAFSDTIAITDYGVLFDMDAAGNLLSRRKVPLSLEEQSARFAYRFVIEPPGGEIVLTRL